MSKIITASKLNRLWKNGVLNIKSALEGSINTEKTERKAEIATERARINELEENGSTVVVNKLATYADIMANNVEGYLPDALAVKEGFTQVNESLTNVSTITVTPLNSSSILNDISIANLNNNIVDLHLYITVSGSITANATIAKVDKAPYKPMYHVPCIYRNNATGALTWGSLFISADGTIITELASTNYNEVHVHCVYLTK